MKHKQDSQLTWKYRCVQRNGRILGEHRWIMEQHLGRRLLRTEHVHHKDGNTLNNHLDNLEVKDCHAHARMHGAAHRRNLPIEVLEEIRNGHVPIREIASRLGYKGKSSVYRKAKFQIPGVISLDQRRCKHGPVVADALDAFFSGVPNVEICKRFGVRASWLYERAQRDPRYDRRPRAVSEAQAKIICAMYRLGYKLNTISAEASCDKATVCRVTRRFNLEKRKPGKALAKTTGIV